MGGDLTGKAIVPIRRTDGGGYLAKFLGEDRRASTDQELADLMAAIRYNGMYPWVATEAELAHMAQDPTLQRELFNDVIGQELERWVRLADESAHGTSRMFVMAGNDDPVFIDDLLAKGNRMEMCDGLIVQVGRYELLSCSYSNVTPWNSPRELDEDGLYSRICGLAEQLTDPSTAIFNLHVPPYDTGLDTAPELTADLSLRTEGGDVKHIPVGSTAVRQVIEEFQPALALHGHIHESRGWVRLGRTLALNPGSEYNSGRIHGVLVKLDEREVLSHHFVVG
jgi:Icc-related predicted phosphoesterase